MTRTRDVVQVEGRLSSVIYSATKAIIAYKGILIDDGNKAEADRVHDLSLKWLTQFQQYIENARPTLRTESGHPVRSGVERPAEPTPAKEAYAKILHLLGKDDKAEDVVDKSVAQKLLREVPREMEQLKKDMAHEILPKASLAESKHETACKNMDRVRASGKAVPSETHEATRKLEKKREELDNACELLHELISYSESEEVKAALK